MTVPRYVLYTRVSTAAQDSNNSHPTQLTALELYAAQRGGEVVEIIRETASGGAYLGRPGIRRALELLESNQADVLACYDFSRYSRDEEHQQAMANRIARAGKRIEFATLELQRDDQGDLTPESRLMFGVSGSFAAYHRAKIRADCSRGLRRVAQNGRQPANSRAPLGYSIASKRDVLTGTATPELLNKYVIVEPAASHVREMFERRAVGESLTQICREMNLAHGHRLTSSGAALYISSLKSILTNTVYIGRASYGKRTRVYDESRLSRGLKNPYSLRTRPDSEVIWIECPALVAMETWNAVQSLWALPKRALGETRSYLLSGILRCPKCGSTMKGRTVRRVISGQGKVTKRRYVCSAALDYHHDNRHQTEKCLGTEYDAPDFDTRVLTTVARLADDAQFFGAAFDRPRVQNDSGASLIEQKLAALESRERLLIEAQLRALVAGNDGSTHEKMLNELGTEKSALRRQLESKPKAIETLDLESRLNVVERLAEMARASDPQTLGIMGRLLTQLIERIEIGDECELQIHFRLD